MTLDSTNIAVLGNAAEKGKVDIDKAVKIVEGFYKGVVHVIQTEQTVIKIPFYGKFMYSNAWKEKREKILLQYKDLKIM